MKSHTLVFKDFDSAWYKHWARELKQNNNNLDGMKLKANKFWQNAVIAEAICAAGSLKNGHNGIGFGVGQERLPALFAKQGIKVMATDQDYKSKRSELWVEQELAIGIQSLNKLGICGPELFASQVRYKAVDMRKIPNDLFGSYDFLWSNCALGHLGSIPEGLNFIKSSLQCLKPGGTAVHTTEVNVLSNEETVESGDTVVFRLIDIYGLFKDLIKNGYICSPLKFNLGRDEPDFRLSMEPKFGNDFSKIQVAGHLLTQAVIIIRKPKYQVFNTLFRPLYLFNLWIAYKRGLREMARIGKINPNVKQLLDSQAYPAQQIKITPTKRIMPVSVSAGRHKEIFIQFSNESPVCLYSAYGHLWATHPTVLATTSPKNRKSLFADKSWVAESSDRPSSRFCLKDNKNKYNSVDYILPGQKFAFRVVINSNNLKKSNYVEEFSVVQEGASWVAGTNVKLSIEVK